MSTTAVRPLEQAPQAQTPQPRLQAVADGASGFRWLGPLRVWHLLSLDAPCVAAVWLLTLSEGGPLHARLVGAAALFIAVWLLYVGDRVLDANGPGPLQARHRFHRRYRRKFQLAAACACPLLVVLLVLLPATVRFAWCLLAVPVAVYAASIHVLPARRLPKELVVAWMFGAACIVPALAAIPSSRGAVVLSGLLFGVVCWLNCVGIARWEGMHLLRETSASTRWGARRLAPLCLVVASVCLLRLHAAGNAALACSVSAGLLLVLDRLRHRLDAVALRALADAALLSPLLLWPLLRWM